jgi:hypothetical protein
MRMAPHPPFYQPGRLMPRSGHSSLRCAYQMKAGTAAENRRYAPGCRRN